MCLLCAVGFAVMELETVFTLGVIILYQGQWLPLPRLLSLSHWAPFIFVILIRTRTHLLMYTDQYGRWRCALSWFANHQCTHKEQQTTSTTFACVCCSSACLCSGVEHVHSLLYYSAWFVLFCFCIFLFRGANNSHLGSFPTSTSTV